MITQESITHGKYHWELFLQFLLNHHLTNRSLPNSPAGMALNDAEAGTGTSTADWIDLVVGEGGVIDCK